MLRTRLLILFCFCFCFVIPATAGEPAVVDVARLPSFQNHVDNDYILDGASPCSTFADGSVTFTAKTRLLGTNKTDYSVPTYMTIRTVYTNGTKCTKRLSADGNYVISSARLSNGNILLAYTQGDTIMEIFAMLLEPCGSVLQNQIKLNMSVFSDRRNVPPCSASSSTFGGFLCLGSSLDKQKPVWARFDNTGSILGDGMKSSNVLDLYPVTNDTIWEGYSAPATTGGFLLVWSYTNNTATNTTQNPSSLFKIVYAAITEPNTPKLNSDPFVIYQTYKYEQEFWYMNGIRACAALQYGDGYSCMILSYYSNSTEHEFTQVKFLSSGTITSVQTFPFPDFSNIFTSTLYYGGLIELFSVINSSGITKQRMTIFDRNLTSVKTLEFSSQNLIEFAFCVDKYNNVYCPYTNGDIGWNYVQFEVPKFMKNDTGYDNLSINSSYPALNQLVSISAPLKLLINFNQGVRLGSGNISIYQYGERIPRQLIPARDFYTSPDYYSISQSISILSSTLNLPDTSYYAVMDDGFVEAIPQNEPLAGVQAGKWIFETVANESQLFSDPVTVLLKVSDDGLKKYEQNSTLFIEQLRQELSEFIPIPETRMTLEYSSKSSSSGGLYFELTFSANNNLTNEMNANGAATNLAILISNPQTTNLQYGNYTKYLDPTVPAIIQYNLCHEFKPAIITISCAVPVLIIVVLLARRRHPEGRNLAIFTIILNTSDFILDSLFIVDHSHDIPDLTIPIMVFYAVPFAMNFLIAVWVVLEEASKNSKFMDWFHDNSKVAAVFTILAVTDVEMLRVLDSEIGGLKIFSATFSDKAIKRMFIASTLSFAFRDVPQLVIMSKYKISIVHYSLVPFLTLITSAALVLIGAITRVYRAISYFRHSSGTAVLEDGSTDIALASPNRSSF